MGFRIANKIHKSDWRSRWKGRSTSGSQKWQANLPCLALTRMYIVIFRSHPQDIHRQSISYPFDKAKDFSEMPRLKRKVKFTSIPNVIRNSRKKLAVVDENSNCQ
jgi:hypothetical protein